MGCQLQGSGIGNSGFGLHDLSYAMEASLGFLISDSEYRISVEERVGSLFLPRLIKDRDLGIKNHVIMVWG